MAQRVLITAGAGGIGLEVVKAFVGAGAHVHIADINTEAVNNVIDQFDNVTGTVGDISDPTAADQIFADVTEHLGGLDVLVNNAGIAGPTKPITEYGEDEFDAVINVNLRGTFNITKRAVPLLKESDAASIITMSSLAGRFGYPNRIGYSTTNSWFMGSNIPGKPRRCLVYVGGAPTYRKICDEVVAEGYRGFELSPAKVLATL